MSPSVPAPESVGWHPSRKHETITDDPVGGDSVRGSCFIEQQVLMRAVAEVIVRNEIVEGIVQLDPARIIAQVVVTDDHLIGKIIQIDRMR